MKGQQKTMEYIKIWERDSLGRQNSIPTIPTIPTVLTIPTPWGCPKLKPCYCIWPILQYKAKVSVGTLNRGRECIFPKNNMQSALTSYYSKTYSTVYSKAYSVI